MEYEARDRAREGTGPAAMSRSRSSWGALAFPSRGGCRAGTALSRARANLRPMTSELKVVTTVSNQAEAEMVCESLSEAGIRSMPQMSSGNIRLGAAAPLDVYVEQHDFDKALAVLNAAVPSDEELTRLSDEAGDKSASYPA